MLQNLMSPEGGYILNRSRFWWEISLNLQILCVALMWFCYSERIDRAQGQKRTLQVIRRWIGIFFVLVPSMFGFGGIFLGWFLTPPDPVLLLSLAGVVLVLWLFVLVLQKTYQLRIGSGWPVLTLQQRLLYFSPTLTLAVIGLFGELSDLPFWLLAIPVFIYLQGAMPFLMRAFAIREVQPET